MMHPSGTAARRGMVLIPVLIMLGVAALLTVNQLFLSRIRLRERESVLQTVQLQTAMTDAALQAMRRLADDDDLTTDHAQEPWAESREYTTPAGISLWIRISDAQSKFDLNNTWLEFDPGEQIAVQTAIMDLLTVLGDYAPVDRIQALSDWLDADSDGYRESDWYAVQGLSNHCPNTWLNSPADLTGVAGFSKEYFTNQHEWARSSATYSMSDYLTILPGPRRAPVTVNVNTAPPALLRAVAGIGQDAWVDYVVTFRSAGPLTSLDPVMAVVEGSRAEYLRKFLDVRSSIYAIHVRAFSGERSALLRALVRRDAVDGSVRVLQWVL